MTNAVLRARLSALGLDPALFTEAELVEIADALHAPPALTPPNTLAFAPFEPPASLCAEIRDAAQRALDAAGENRLGFSFDASNVHAACADACAAIDRALPRKTEGLTDWLQAYETDRAKKMSALEQAQGELRHLACLRAAAQLRRSAEVAEYERAIAAQTAAIVEAEAILARDADTVADVMQLFDLYIPALLETADPLFRGEPAEFRRSTFRTAALRLREAAKRAVSTER